jgi:glutamine synthetase
MTENEILSFVASHPGKRVKLAMTDIDGVLRGKYVSTDKFLSAVQSDLGFCNVVFGWDMADVAYDNSTYTGWHSGYPDAPVRIDLSTFRSIPWENDVPPRSYTLLGGIFYEHKTHKKNNMQKQVFKLNFALGTSVKVKTRENQASNE